jgi:hypothetical protein
LNLFESNPAQVTNGAPLARRQVRQWQWVIPEALPETRYRTAPQRQPPSMALNDRMRLPSDNAHHRLDLEKMVSRWIIGFADLCHELTQTITTVLTPMK